MYSSDAFTSCNLCFSFWFHVSVSSKHLQPLFNHWPGIKHGLRFFRLLRSSFRSMWSTDLTHSSYLQSRHGTYFSWSDKRFVPPLDKSKNGSTEFSLLKDPRKKPRIDHRSLNPRAGSRFVHFTIRHGVCRTRSYRTEAIHRTRSPHDLVDGDFTHRKKCML